MSDNKNEGQFPGYPHYPAGEDITNVNNGTHKINVSTGGSSAGTTRTDDNGDTDADITAEDREALAAAFQNREVTGTDAEESVLDTTDEDGDPLNERAGTYDRTGSDLDVPGSEEDDAEELTGGEDEENNYYSLGGDNHTELEEDQ